MNKNKFRHISITAFIIGLMSIFPYKADAYIDPNTGGFFFTSVLPFVYGILVAIVIFWKKIVLFVKNFVSRLYKKS